MKHPTRQFGWFCILGALSCVQVALANEPSGDELEFFEKQVRPLLVRRCYSCHSIGAKQEGGLLLDSRPGWAQGGDRGAAIVPGDVDASLVIQAVRRSDPDLRMPPEQALPVEEIAVLERWVRSGAHDPRDKPSDAASLGPLPWDPVAGRSHWAFQPLRYAVAPVVHETNWIRTRVDPFVAAKLERENLHPAADAGRQILIRRLYFQLLGLPPTPEQSAEFVADQRPDAWERLVDQLLASPHFGERWGRHWLDLARYADSNGLDENFLFREAWRYRNWVIAATNEDQPFDQFLLQQLAGDLLPYESLDQRDRQRMAAGFLLVGPKVLLGNDPNKQRMEVADEQLDTIGRAILGQTLGCARCHDHKFDPIPTSDYYALAGIMTSTQVMEQRFMLNEQRVMERLVGLGADGEALDDAYELYYRELPKTRETEKQAKAAVERLEKGDLDGLKTLAEMHAGSVAAEALDGNQPADRRLQAQRDHLAAIQKNLANAPPIPPRAMIPTDSPNPADESIRLAGQFDRLGEKVPRGFLRVLGDRPAEFPSGQSGRIELGRWLTDQHNGAGRLAARVLANRIWHHLIGRGLVRTVDNFGRTGEPPSHPELLDALANDLVQAKWSVKSLVRRIVLSHTFTTSSQHDAVAHSTDPENVLLWRAHRRRLDPEAMRDAMLFAAGELDVKPMESSVWYLGDQATAVGDNKVRRRTDFPCRSVYLPVIRNDLPDIFDAFDFANPHTTTGMRPQTTVPTQGLFLLNHESVMRVATAAARRWVPSDPSDEAARAAISQMFLWVVNAPPSKEDEQSLLVFVRDMQSEFAADGPDQATLKAWALACHALFASSHFQMVE